MAGNRRTNKCRNQLRGGGDVNARWFDKQIARNRKRNKIARQSRRKNRGK